MHAEPVCFRYAKLVYACESTTFHLQVLSHAESCSERVMQLLLAVCCVRARNRKKSAPQPFLFSSSTIATTTLPHRRLEW